MDKDEIREEVLNLLQELHEDIDFESETKMVDDKVLDSFDLASFATELGDAFDVEITGDDLVAEKFNSIDSIVDMIADMME